MRLFKARKSGDIHNLPAATVIAIGESKDDATANTSPTLIDCQQFDHSNNVTTIHLCATTDPNNGLPPAERAFALNDITDKDHNTCSVMRTNANMHVSHINGSSNNNNNNNQAVSQNKKNHHDHYGPSGGGNFVTSMIATQSNQNHHRHNEQVQQQQQPHHAQHPLSNPKRPHHFAQPIGVAGTFNYIHGGSRSTSCSPLIGRNGSKKSIFDVLFVFWVSHF